MTKSGLCADLKQRKKSRFCRTFGGALGRTRTCDLLIRSQTRSRTRGDTEGRGETKPRFYQGFSTPEGTRRDRERHGVVVSLWYERAGGGKAFMSADSFLPAALCFLLRCCYCRAVRLTTFFPKGFVPFPRRPLFSGTMLSRLGGGATFFPHTEKYFPRCLFAVLRCCRIALGGGFVSSFPCPPPLSGVQTHVGRVRKHRPSVWRWGE